MSTSAGKKSIYLEDDLYGNAKERSNYQRFGNDGHICGVTHCGNANRWNSVWNKSRDTFYIPIGAAIFAGPVYLLLIAKVTKPGSLTITGILLGILYFVLGMHWAMDLGLVIGGILADIIAGVKKYRSSTLNIVAYAVQCLGFTQSIRRHGQPLCLRAGAQRRVIWKRWQARILR